MKIPNQKSLFNIPDTVTYLNCAYMSPGLKKAADAGAAAILKRNEPWKYEVSDWFEPAVELKSLFASLIHANSRNIALIPSVSYGIAVAKQNIRLNGSREILVLDQQYPSNMYAWKELSLETGAKIVTVKREEGSDWTEAILHHITEKTGLVAIPNCHWTNGGLLDLKTIGAKTKATGSVLVIDASQSAGVYPVDMEIIKPDFFITAGYKWLLGPYGLAYLYADDKYLTDGRPIEYTWTSRSGSEDFTRLVDYTETFKDGAARFDAGATAAFINIPMAKEALIQILEWGVENIQETISGLTGKIAKSAVEHGYEISDSERAGHMIGIRLHENQIKETGKALSDNKVYISFRGTSMRIAPHLYNDEKDIERLFQFL